MRIKIHIFTGNKSIFVRSYYIAVIYVKKLLRFICGILSIAILQFVLVAVHAESTEYATGYEADSNTWINNHLYLSEPAVQSFPMMRKFRHIVR